MCWSIRDKAIMIHPNLYFSTFLFLIFAFFVRRNRFSIVNKIGLILLSISYILLYLLFVISDRFTANGIDESVIFHLKYGLAGAGFASELKLIIFSITASLASFYYLYRIFFIKYNKYSKQWAVTFLLYLLIVLALAFHPAVHDLYKLNQVHSGTSSNAGYSNFNNYYRTPHIKKINNTSKNLIVIYAEGMENTYFDNDIFPDLIKDLRKLKSNRLTFSNITQIVGTGWTIAGFVASQCGIPLVAMSHGNSMSGMDSFLQSAVCVSDLLHNEDYKLIFYGGADHHFGGKGKFLKTHEFDEIYGEEELASLLPDESYLNEWGIDDDIIFDIAYERFIELSMQDDNFALFMLTLGTHRPGFIANKCKGERYKQAPNPMLNAVACSDYLISDFINRILLSAYAENTVIVLLSDHFSMHNSATNLLNQGNRKNLFMIIDSSIEKTTENARLGSTLDISPTLLPFMGFEGSLGLGTNLLTSDRNEEETKLIHRSIPVWNYELLQFWKFPRIVDFVYIDKDEAIFSIDDNLYKYPALITFDNELKTELGFDFDRAKVNKNIFNIMKDLGEENHFILIDECSTLNEIDHSFGQDGYCILIGTGNNYVKKWILEDSVRLDINEILRILKIESKFKMRRIAHAGGGIDNRSYTNSFEALNYNLNRGFTYFEIDFSFTADEHLVCVHDFDQSFARVSGVDFKSRPTINQFNEIISNQSGYQICSLDTLAAWLEMNPSVTLITDVKDDNLKALKLIKEKVPNYKNQVIPQIYKPHNYSKVKDLGYNQIIWTLYRYDGSSEDVYNWALKFDGPFAITMPKSRAKTQLPRHLAAIEIPTYVHTINSEEDANQFINEYGIKEIYTDFLPPNN